jgi:hypothetical protein
VDSSKTSNLLAPGHQPAAPKLRTEARSEGSVSETLDEYQAADFLGVRVKTLRNWRVQGSGPPFIKYGNKLVRYRRSDLGAWQEGQLRRSTSDKGGSRE